MTSEPARQERTEMTAVDRSQTTASVPSEPNDDEMSVVDVLKRAVIGFVVLVVGLSLLGGVGALVFDGAIGDAEADFVTWVAEQRAGVLDTVANNASSLSDTWTVIGVVVGAVTMLWAAGHTRYAATVVLAILFEFGTFLVVGAVIARSRPDVEALGSIPSTPSFPSGHTAAAFVIYGSLVFVARSLSSQSSASQSSVSQSSESQPSASQGWSTRSIPRSVWLVPLFLALLVAAARVYEGVHYPTDVAAGLLLGIGAVVAASVATGLTDLPDTPGRTR